MLLSVLLLLLRLLPRATPLLHGTTASSGPPDASSVTFSFDYRGTDNTAEHNADGPTLPRGPS